MSTGAARVLVVSTDNDLFHSVRALLHSAGINPDHVTWTPNPQDAQHIIARQVYDVVVVAESLAEQSGIELIRNQARRGHLGPFLVVTEQSSVSLDLEAREAGAQFCLAKEELTAPLLTRMIQSAVEHTRTRREREAREAQMRHIFERNPIAMAIIDERLHYVRVNGAFCLLVGHDAGELAGEPVSTCLSANDNAFEEAVRRVLAGSSASRSREIILVGRDGRPFRARTTISLLPGRTPKEREVVLVVGEHTSGQDKPRNPPKVDKPVRTTTADPIAAMNDLRLAGAIIDENDAIANISQEASRFLGMPRGALEGKPWESLLAAREEDLAQIRKIVGDPSSQEPHSVQILHRTTGQFAFVDVSVQLHPTEPNHKLLLFHDAAEIERLNRLIRNEPALSRIVGRSASLQAVLERITKVANVDTTALITGETGTGKELVARAVHELSERRRRPFVAVNCAGLTDSLLASQLFGHKRGAFTGATGDHRGFFETAHGGTLFLDEIGDISSAVQTSLLRVLEEQEIIRLGDSIPRPIDVRVIAATHRDLQAEVGVGRFRADLVYRIQVARIALPALRERRQDIPTLVDTFIAEYRSTMGKKVRGVDTEAMGLMLGYPWPGNVRELRSAIEYGMIGCKSELLRVVDLPPEIAAFRPDDSSRLYPSDSLDAYRLRKALEETHGNRSAAARLLGISRATLYRHLRAVGLQ